MFQGLKLVQGHEHQRILPLVGCETDCGVAETVKYSTSMIQERSTEGVFPKWRLEAGELGVRKKGWHGRGRSQKILCSETGVKTLCKVGRLGGEAKVSVSVLRRRGAEPQVFDLLTLWEKLSPPPGFRCQAFCLIDL